MSAEWFWRRPSRRPGESIRIGDDVTIAVLDVKGTNVRIRQQRA